MKSEDATETLELILYSGLPHSNAVEGKGPIELKCHHQHENDTS